MTSNLATIVTLLTEVMLLVSSGATLGAISPNPKFKGAGAVYTLSNASSGNKVLEFRRGLDGSLKLTGSVASGGNGNDSNLGSQGAVVISNDQEWLFAVNPGSNSISSFAIKSEGLVLMDTAESGGTTPVSLAVEGHLLYVLNQGEAGNITGFWVDSYGRLSLIENSTRLLSSSNAGAAEVAFSPDQGTLVVSEKQTGVLDTYKVQDHGMVTGPTIQPSNGSVPFGFTFTGQGELLVTEAGSNSVSSYDLDGQFLSTTSPKGTKQWRSSVLDRAVPQMANSPMLPMPMSELLQVSVLVTKDYWNFQA